MVPRPKTKGSLAHKLSNKTPGCVQLIGGQQSDEGRLANPITDSENQIFFFSKGFPQAACSVYFMGGVSFCVQSRQIGFTLLMANGVHRLKVGRITDAAVSDLMRKDECCFSKYHENKFLDFEVCLKRKMIKFVSILKIH
ncbi:hypothetical protein CEXT_29511 [Caerostris extrusa]|uniref:Uncharacterized protein n=1 Tax=Caerostris extrusa TaxID=172846 RepID=A0AAV4XVI8_CAEEX|nr:hypothetical protein CEXT_29511 [Caerostris extrusa]